MNILFVDSGAAGFHSRYAFDIYSTLMKEYLHTVKQVSPKELSYGMIGTFKPDVLLVVHGTRTPLDMVDFARKRGITTVLWLVEDPYEIDQHRGKMVNAYDYVFTNEKQAVKEYCRPGVYYLPWCCNPRVHKRIAVPGWYESDICFIGMGFPNRVALLNDIAPVLKKYNVKLIGNWNHWGAKLHPDLKQFVLPVVDNFLEVQRYYNGAQINLNLHRDPEDPPSGNSQGVRATSLNDRAFALAGCGVFQLIDNVRPDLKESFVEGQEIVSFANPKDLAEKIAAYLPNREKREAIGRAAQKKAYQCHTFKHRLDQIFRTIRVPSVQKSNARVWTERRTSTRVYYFDNYYQ